MPQSSSQTNRVTPNSVKTTAPTYLVTNARVPGYEGFHQIWIDPSGMIQTIQPMNQALKRLPPDSLKILDIAGDWVSLGGVDGQINGALGLAFPDVTERDFDRLSEICQFLWQQGLDGFLPTIVTTSGEKIRRSLDAIAAFRDRPQPSRSARILGVHLEGPFLHPAKRGAHPQEHLQPLTLDTVQAVLGPHSSLVRVMTLAPELDPTHTVIPYLRAQGIVVSLGHSQATAQEANAAFEQGASMVTHAFNAMPSLHHREPGLLGAALLRSGIHCGLIADGQHITPAMVDLLVRLSRGNLSGQSIEDGLFLVSDALAPLGLPDGTYPWDSRQITVTHGTARLDDGTLAGTTLPLLEGVKNLVRWGVCSPGEAIALATTAPRRALRPASTPSGKGSRAYNPDLDKSASLLRWKLDSTTQELTWQRLLPRP